MSYVVAFVGSKGGTGKSRLAQAFAVEAVKSKVSVILGDMDRGPQSSTLWGELRAANKWLPPVDVKTMDRLDWAASSPADILVCDTAGFAEKFTRDLATFAHLVVVPMGCDLSGDCYPTHKLLQEFVAAGIPRDKLAPVLVKATSPSLTAAARSFMEEGGFPLLKQETHFLASYVQAFNVGKAMTEAKDEGPREAAKKQVREIAKLLARQRDHEVAAAPEIEREHKGRGR